MKLKTESCEVMKFNQLVPELSVSDVNQSKHFYVDILDFKIEYERAEDNFAFLSYGQAQLMLDEGPNGSWSTGITEYPFGRGINFQINVDDIDRIYQSLQRNNIKLFRDKFSSRYKANKITYVEEEILVQDPDGYLLRFSKILEEE